jgi:hypothetical protein
MTLKLDIQVEQKLNTEMCGCNLKSTIKVEQIKRLRSCRTCDSHEESWWPQMAEDSTEYKTTEQKVK